MSVERPITEVKPDTPPALNSSNVAVIDDEMSDDEKAGRAMLAALLDNPNAYKAKQAVLLDRGILHQRLKVDVPEDLHYEWVRNNPVEIDRKRALGFWLDTKYSTKRAIHSDGSSANVIGDTVCMLTLKKNKEMIDQIYFEQSMNSTKNPKKAQEETAFAASVLKETGGDIPTFIESQANSLSLNDVRAAMERANSQIKVQR